MNIHEYQAKQLFLEYGIPVPLGKFATSSKLAEQATEEINSDAWVVKAQVHAGGRGKAGGVKVANTKEQVNEIAKKLLGEVLVTKQTGPEGLPIESVLVEQTCAIKHELYLSLLVDRGCEKCIFIASAAGGMDIEAVAEDTPEKIISLAIDPAAGLQGYQCRQVGFFLGFGKPQLRELEKVMRGMYQLFLDKDASQIEINPLIETEQGNLMALDAKINFDDSALALHQDIMAMKDPGQEDEKENKAEQFGLNYITLDGTIGCMVNGAGLAMATMDLVKLKGGAPANFLDVGGGANAEKVAEAFKLILSDAKVNAVLVNIFGGIVRCDMIAEGILAAINEVEVNVPVVVRLEGTNAEAGRTLLNESGMNLVAAPDLASAAAKVVELSGAAA